MAKPLVDAFKHACLRVFTHAPPRLYWCRTGGDCCVAEDKKSAQYKFCAVCDCLDPNVKPKDVDPKGTTPTPKTTVVLDGDFDEVVGKNKDGFLKECTKKLSNNGEKDIECFDVYAGSIILVLQGAPSALQEAASDVQSEGLELPGFPPLKAVPTTTPADTDDGDIGESTPHLRTGAKSNTMTPSTTADLVITTSASSSGESSTAAATAIPGAVPSGPISGGTDTNVRVVAMVAAPSGTSELMFLVVGIVAAVIVVVVIVAAVVGMCWCYKKKRKAESERLVCNTDMLD